MIRGRHPYPQADPFASRGRHDTSRGRDRDPDGPGAPPGCDRHARMAGIRADGQRRRRDPAGDAVRRPQYPSNRIRERGRSPVPSQRLPAVRCPVLRTGEWDQPLGPHGTIRRPRRNDARVRLPHAPRGRVRDARYRGGRLRGRERDGRRAVPPHDACGRAPPARGEIQAQDEVVEVELSTIEPLIACPSSPDNVKAVREVAGTEVAPVAVGSSVNSSFRDLSVVAQALDGKHVAPGISMSLSPGSRQTLLLMLTTGLMTKLIKAGVRELEVACGPCIGMGFAPPTKGPSVRTFNRNFEGRSGTADDLVYLCSPETAAATAGRGGVPDPRRPRKFPNLKEPTKYPIDTSGFEWPPKDRASVQIIRGPNIAPLPVAKPPRDTIEGEVLIRLGDNISTDHIMPAGAKVLPLRSNIPAIAEHVFEYVDPTFPERAKQAGGGFIVAGENYGQGSSREHAAVAPMFLGVHLVLARGFARIHMDKLVNSSLPPVTFVDAKGYDAIQQGDRVRITNLLAAIRGHGDAIVENLTRGTKTSVRVELRPYQRAVLLAGGGIRYAQSRRAA